MCIICVDLIKQKLTVLEAERNVGEFIMFPPVEDDLSHYTELADALDEMDLGKFGEGVDEGKEDG